MNCPKCNSPINEGDKFCQVCGNVLNNEPQSNAVEVPPVADVNQMQQPMAASMNQSAPMEMNNGMNMGQPAPQPMPNQMPPVQPNPQMGGNVNQYSNIPQEPKKNNNTMIIILAIVAVALVVGIVFLLMGSDDKEEKEKEPEVVEKEDDEEKEDEEENPPVEEEEEDPPVEEEEPPVEEDESGNTVAGIKFNLPSGYYSFEQSGQAAFTDAQSTFVVAVNVITQKYEAVDAETLKNQLSTQYEITSYAEKTMNGKKFIVFYAELQGFKAEILYIKQSSTTVAIAAIVYTQTPTTTKTNEIYNILTTMEVSSKAISPNSSTIPAVGNVVE